MIEVGDLSKSYKDQGNDESGTVRAAKKSMRRRPFGTGL